MPELMIIAFVALLIFGNRLPSVMRSLGKSVTEFKKGISGIEDEIDQAVTADKKTEPAPSLDRARAFAGLDVPERSALPAGLAMHQAGLIWTSTRLKRSLSHV